MSRKKRNFRKTLSRNAFYRFEWKKIRHDMVQRMYDAIVLEEFQRNIMRYYGDDDE